MGKLGNSCYSIWNFEKERRAKIKEDLKLVDLENKADMYVKNYSGGMKRRLEFARRLIHEPIVLFLEVIFRSEIFY